MVLDGDTIAAYVAAAAAGAGRSSPDMSMESLLDQLVQQVTWAVGRGPVDRLVHNPYDQAVVHEVGLLIDGAMSRDRSLARELANVVSELEQRGGSQLVGAAPAGHAVPRTAVVGSGTHRADGRGSRTHPILWFHLATAPLWAKIVIVVGLLVFLGGLGVIVYTFTTVPGLVEDMPESGNPDLPTGFFYGFVTCFAGVMVAMIGSAGAGVSRRR